MLTKLLVKTVKEIKIFTLGNLIRAGLFIVSGGLSGGIEQAITTAAKQYVKKKAVEYAAEKIGIGKNYQESGYIKQPCQTT